MALCVFVSSLHLVNTSPIEYIIEDQNGKTINPMAAGVYYRQIRSPLFPRVGKRMASDELLNSFGHTPFIRVFSQ
ncbi:hypothetical protein FGIG_05146 [Fasciola gigantica]|uniref:Uncharacterized protein n=1 Tax=Fasciola gigantica TaxID=46835 RepID=A0A504YGX2_FASGI|nr:hypothetical protein FGIG_05146 [Fasciola gigantica]